MILKAALCKQDFMAKEIQKSGDFSSRTITEEILLSSTEKSTIPPMIPNPRKKKPVPFLQRQSEAAILAQHGTCHCQLRKVLDNFQYYFKPKPTLYVLSRHAQIFRFLPPLVNRSWKDWDNYFI